MTQERAGCGRSTRALDAQDVFFRGVLRRRAFGSATTPGGNASAPRQLCCAQQRRGFSAAQDRDDVRHICSTSTTATVGATLGNFSVVVRRQEATVPTAPALLQLARRSEASRFRFQKKRQGAALHASVDFYLSALGGVAAASQRRQALAMATSLRSFCSAPFSSRSAALGFVMTLTCGGASGRFLLCDARRRRGEVRRRPRRYSAHQSDFNSNGFRQRLGFGTTKSCGGTHSTLGHIAPSVWQQHATVLAIPARTSRGSARRHAASLRRVDTQRRFAVSIFQHF